MTRFARAKGSKSSNEKVAEKASSWSELKQQGGETSASDKTALSDAQSALKQIKEKRSGNASGWAAIDAPESQNNANKRQVSELEEGQSTAKKAKMVKNGGSGIQKSPTGRGQNASKAAMEKEVEASAGAENRPGPKGKGGFQGKKPLGPKAAGAKNGPGQRRKPLVSSSTIHVSGISIEVSKFDGFDVKTEDAVRLTELKAKMLEEGIPAVDVNRAIKLERRRAEKALAREKKKVCFNCRKAGHLLSECPQVGSSKVPDSTAVNICYKCGSTEHTHFQCQVKKGTEYSFATCFICEEQGHISSQCPDNPRGLYPQGGSCKICGEVTHLKKDCPQLSEEKSENTLTVGTISSGSNLESLGEDVEAPKMKKPQAPKKKVVKF